MKRRPIVLLYHIGAGVRERNISKTRQLKDRVEAAVVETSITE